MLKIDGVASILMRGNDVNLGDKKSYLHLINTIASHKNKCNGFWIWIYHLIAANNIFKMLQTDKNSISKLFSYGLLVFVVLKAPGIIEWHHEWTCVALYNKIRDHMYLSLWKNRIFYNKKESFFHPNL